MRLAAAGSHRDRSWLRMVALTGNRSSSHLGCESKIGDARACATFDAWRDRGLAEINSIVTEDPQTLSSARVVRAYLTENIHSPWMPIAEQGWSCIMMAGELGLARLAGIGNREFGVPHVDLRSSSGDVQLERSCRPRSGCGCRASETSSGSIVTYQIDRNINYTNYCTDTALFATSTSHEVGDGYTLSKQVIFDKIQETFDLGGTRVDAGRLNSDLKIEWYEDLLSSIKQRYPAIHCIASRRRKSAASRGQRLSIRDTIARLRDSGLDSIPAAARRSSTTKFASASAA